jgi:glycosyltransferase involved in cell wall biosynthesis
VRILHLVSYPLFSGPMPHVIGLASAQRERGDTVWIAYDVKRGNFDGFEEDARPRVEAAGFTSPPQFTLSTKSSALETVRDVRALQSFVREEKIEVVHAHMSHDHTLMSIALRKPKELGVVRVRTVHAERALEHRFGRRALMKRAEAWVVRSQSHARQMRNHFQVDATRLHVIPGSVDARLFAPRPIVVRAALRRRLEIPDDVVLVGHVALIAPERGQEELVRAIALMGDSPVHAMFVGRGESEHAIRELARELGISHRIHFPGSVAVPELVDMYAAMDAALVARPGNDAASRSALEAMACGLPVIALREAALAETVTDRVGFPISSATAENMARAMRQILDDRADARYRGETARELVATSRTFALEAELTREAYLSGGVTL